MKWAVPGALASLVDCCSDVVYRREDAAASWLSEVKKKLQKVQLQLEGLVAAQSDHVGHKAVLPMLCVIREVLAAAPQHTSIRSSTPNAGMLIWICMLEWILIWQNTCSLCIAYKPTLQRLHSFTYMPELLYR